MIWLEKLMFQIQILENIKHRPGKTFRMFDKHNPLDESHVRMVMKALGHFHGRWIKYKFMSQAGQVSLSKFSGKKFSYENSNSIKKNSQLKKQFVICVCFQLKKLFVCFGFLLKKEFKFVFVPQLHLQELKIWYCSFSSEEKKIVIVYFQLKKEFQFVFVFQL